MPRKKVKAAFYRGGTSKALMFNAADLPESQALRDRMFLAVIGSPDAYGRQLDGMGGGLSSVSKVVIVEPSPRDDADVDYTFVQLAVDKAVADYGQLCGNMSAAVGPFALEEGLIQATDGEAMVRVHNTNTSKVFVARFAVKDGLAVESGEFEIPGVSQTGAKVQLDFLDPGGSATGKLLPTGRPRDHLDIADGLEVSLVDASNPVVFARAEALGITGAESPAALDADAALMEKLDRIRRAGAVAMGLAEHPDDALLSSPKVALVAPPRPFTALDGRKYGPDTFHLSVRLVSMGNFHRAITLTGAMCTAVAARIPGTLLEPFVPETGPEAGDVLIGNPSGILPLKADVEHGADGPKAVSATTFRTQRRIMEGFLPYPDAVELA